MRATRRFWGVALLGAFLAALAVLLGRPLLLFGVAGLAAWLLAHQYVFLERLERELDGVKIDVTLPRDRVVTSESTPFALSVTRDGPAPLALSVEARPPVAADAPEADALTVELDAGQLEADLAASLSWPVAGRFTCDPPAVVATDPLGLLSESLYRGPTPTVTVTPRGPRNLHVGEGGREVAIAYGEHEGNRPGTGLDPAELRQYVTGDPAARIDWKATARLADPYVREFESETERRTALLVDHRGDLGDGPAGETKLDYLRGVALAFTASVRDRSDPLGCYAVGEEGLTARYAPAATEEGYATIRALLEGLEPTVSPGASADSNARNPAVARRMADTLTTGAAFDERLRPFFADARSYVRRIGGDPLFEAARTEIAGIDGAVWTVILTDDSHPERLREAVTVASRGGEPVLVFLAPTVLFEPGGLADLEAAYDRYVAFEEFRRDLAGLPGVSAFEVAPGDRLDAVLATGRGRRENRPAGRV